MRAHPQEVLEMACQVPGAPQAGLTVAPGSADEVAAVLRHATEGGLAVQVWGGGTHSGYGNSPSPDIVLSTRNLAEITAWEPDDLTVVVGAGASVAPVEAELRSRRQSMVFPERPGEATVGGVIASAGAPLRRARLYGIRERVLETVVVTGDGRVVRSGGRVVKNVTGYDLSRLHVGAFGSLGVIVSVCLKLWPVPPGEATVEVVSPSDAAVVTRPLAVLEERGRTRVYLSGTHEEVAAMTSRFDGAATAGHDWPRDPDGPFRWSLRVPAGLTTVAVSRLPGDWSYLAVHGVGDIRTASPDAGGARDLREWAGSVGGHLVSVAAPAGELDGLDPWGPPPPAAGMQRQLIARFDPARVINPGRLPGGL